MSGTAPGDPYQISITDLEMSARTTNCFREAGIFTLADVARHSEQELMRIPYFGRKSLNEVKEVLAMNGLELGIPVPRLPPADPSPPSPPLPQELIDFQAEIRERVDRLAVAVGGVYAENRLTRDGLFELLMALRRVIDDRIAAMSRTIEFDRLQKMNGR